MTVDNGPDRSLGRWRWATTGSGTLALKGGVFVIEVGGFEYKTSAGSLASLLGAGNTPLDATAKREAIRAGWRKVDGKWVNDERKAIPVCVCGSDCFYPEPECYESAARARGERPADEAPPAPAPAKPTTKYRLAKQALREACDEAREQGREDERRRQQAKPCVLKRLEGVDRERWTQDFSDEGTAAHLLLTVIEYAKAKGLDLSALAERLVGEVKP